MTFVYPNPGSKSVIEERHIEESFPVIVRLSKTIDITDVE